MPPPKTPLPSTPLPVVAAVAPVITVLEAPVKIPDDLPNINLSPWSVSQHPDAVAFASGASTSSS